MFKGETSIREEYIEKATEVYGLLNTLLERDKFVAGCEVTIADLSLFSTITSLNIIIPIDTNKHPLLNAWLGVMKQLPYCSVNEPGLKQFEVLVKSKLQPCCRSE